jgi:hypothetical protein
MGLDTLLPEIVKTIIAALAPLIAAGLVWVIVQLARKLGLSISADQQAIIKVTAQDLIFRYEEQAAALMKDKIAVPADYKIRGAMTGLVDKFPNITREQARAIVEAELPKVGLGAAATFRALHDAQPR